MKVATDGMVKGTSKRTIYRSLPKGKEDLVSSQILAVVRSSQHPIATQEIAALTKHPWHSIQTRCLKLHIEGKLTGFRVGRINLWQAV